MNKKDKKCTNVAICVFWLVLGIFQYHIGCMDAHISDMLRAQYIRIDTYFEKSIQ